MKRSEVVNSLAKFMTDTLADFFTKDEAAEILSFLEGLGVVNPSYEALMTLPTEDGDIEFKKTIPGWRPE